jgi:type I restriction enzyme R subunit
MATGTRKTYTTFQIIWRLWKAKKTKRTLFLVDRNILADQTLVNDFKPFGSVMTKIRNRKIDPSYEIYLGLYQALTGADEEDKIFKTVSPDFFDLIIIDECHRGSAAEDSAWREILTYFSGATQIGLTATPKETKYTSNITYFGEPIYTYKLKQGIEDGFLAPYKVVRYHLDKDLIGWTPPPGMIDDLGQEIEQRTYNQADMDRVLVLNQRTKLVAKCVMQLLNATDPFSKTIIFCEDIDHAERMRVAITNAAGKLALDNPKYVMRIVSELAEYGIELPKLAAEVGKDYGDFDLICHIAYDQPPLTRKERAENVRKRNYFAKYGDQARAVLEALLDKYADEGVLTIESPKVLKLIPFTQMGTPVEIINDVFGGKANYETALQDLEREIFDQKLSA